MPAVADPRSTESASPSAPPGDLFGRTAGLFFLLGFATGIPLGYGWFNLAALLRHGSSEAALTDDIATPLFASLTALTLASFASFLIAPFLDRWPVPGFRRWSHRRSWVAAPLFVALAGAVATAGAFALAPHIGEAALRIGGYLAFPLFVVMTVAVDALRIEVAPGRAQAAAYASQFAGSLVALAVLPQMVGTDANGFIVATPLLLAIVVAQLGIALFVLLRLDEPVPAAIAPIARSPFAEAVWFLRPFEWLWGALVRPWTAFFQRHGAAAPLFIAAITLYALAGSALEHVGSNAFNAGADAISDRERLEEFSAAVRALEPFQWVSYLVGGALGAGIALRMAPARAFNALQKAIIGLALVLVVAKLAADPTPATLVVARALALILVGAGFVVYNVAAARLTAPPHTAGQFYLLALFVLLFWLGSGALGPVARQIGHIALAVGAAMCALGAMACMHLAGRAVARTRATPRPAAGAAR